MKLKLQRRLIWVAWGVLALLEGLVLLAKSGWRSPPSAVPNLLGILPAIIVVCGLSLALDYWKRHKSSAPEVGCSSGSKAGGDAK